MRDQSAPILLSQFLLSSIVEERTGEGASDREEDEPVTRGKFPAEVGYA